MEQNHSMEFCFFVIWNKKAPQIDPKSASCPGISRIVYSRSFVFRALWSTNCIKIVWDKIKGFEAQLSHLELPRSMKIDVLMCLLKGLCV